MINELMNASCIVLSDSDILQFHQESQNKAHCGRLDTLAEEIHTLKKKQADACAALTEAKRKQSELAHRVLRYGICI